MSLFSALNSSTNALSAFERAMTVSQNNVSNSSTPGYARQTATFEALPFDGEGQTGGVTSGAVQDSRSQFAEQNVWSNSSQLGQSQQQVQSLTALQGSFDVSGTSGIPAALTSLYSAFSNWSTSTNSSSGQQQVLSSAQSVASAFQTTAQQVSQAATSSDSSISSVLSQVNSLAAQLSGYNAQILAGGNNSGLSADIYSTLQTLSQLVNFNVAAGPSGTVTVMLGGGQSALVNGTNAQTLSVSLFVPQPPPPVNPNGPPTAHVMDAQGNDITSQISGGSLAGLLNYRNNTLASIQGDGSQTGSLNQLAKSFADRVNTLLTNGFVSTGPPPVQGTALFTYDTTNSTNIANSLEVNPAITAQQLAPNDGTSSNGVAVSLANLSSSQNSADQINGQTYTQYFGSIAAGVGSDLSSAQTNETGAQDQVTQAEALRQQVSGVDLNQEASQILQFQQAFTAASKVVSVIDNMTQTVLGLVTPSQVV